MENLIRKKLIETPELVKILSKFGDEPAIFYQKSPEDIQWQKQNQYPRVIFAIDKFSNAERGTYGALSFEIVCSETNASPEEVEILIRGALEGIFFTPTAGETFSAKWRDTSLMQEQISDKENLIFGALVNFDIYEYPAIKTSDPDPIAALNEYALNWYEKFFVIDESELPPFLKPTRERPAIFQIENIFVDDSAKIRNFHEKISRQNSQTTTSENSTKKLWTLHKKIADSSEFVSEEKRNFKSDLGYEIENVHNRRNYSGDEKIYCEYSHKFNHRPTRIDNSQRRSNFFSNNF